MWWIVTVYTAIAFFPPFFALLWECSSPSKYNDPVACLAFESSSESDDFFQAIDSMNIVFHTSIELMILILPSVYIRRLQMSRMDKINAVSVFTTMIVTIIVGLLRNVSSMLGGSIPISIEDTVAVLEPALAVIICALPPYKHLLLMLRKRRNDIALQQKEAAEGGPEIKSKRPPRVHGSITELEMPIV